MRGRLWALWLLQTGEGALCVFMGLAKDSLPATISLMVRCLHPCSHAYLSCHLVRSHAGGAMLHVPCTWARHVYGVCWASRSRMQLRCMLHRCLVWQCSSHEPPHLYSVEFWVTQ